MADCVENGEAKSRKKVRIEPIAFVRFVLLAVFLVKRLTTVLIKSHIKTLYKTY